MFDFKIFYQTNFYFYLVIEQVNILKYLRFIIKFIFKQFAI